MASSESRFLRGLRMDTRQERVGKNEVLFRDVNERIKDINRDMGVEDEADFICECGNVDCAVPITLKLHEYESVRGHPARFVLFPGHEDLDVERVVEQNDRFIVVEKFPEATARIAIEHDPRA
jgi:uncharacterized UPF0160 family protein